MLEHEEIRRRILIGLFSDDDLMDALVLKGGNALAMIHKVGRRTSIDLDFSVSEAFPDADTTRERIFAALRREFSSIGYQVFDESFEPKPVQQNTSQPKWWGGYLVKFKIASNDVFEKYGENIDELRRRSEVVGPAHLRTYTLDISHHEFCEGKVRRDLDDYAVYVYSLEMIAAEKLRAICQQLPSYAPLRAERPRARDFFDIFQIVQGNAIHMEAEVNLEVLGHIFDAKHVGRDLLLEIRSTGDYHRQDWPAVEAAVSGPMESFDYYFEYVCDLAENLHSAWIKNSPAG